MTKKRFERIYADVDVFCRDHNAKGISQLIEKEDYDKIVDLLNELHNKYIDEYALRETLQLDLQRVEEENTHIKNTIKEMYNNERTELGKSTLKQLLETIQ